MPGQFFTTEKKKRLKMPEEAPLEAFSPRYSTKSTNAVWLSKANSLR